MLFSYASQQDTSRFYVFASVCTGCKCKGVWLRHSHVARTHMSMSSSRRRAQVGPIEASSLLYLLYQREAETECCRAERISCRLVHDVTLQVKGTCVLMNTGVSYDGS